MKQKVIYAIKNKINNKIYIGSTINFTERKKGHLYTLRRGKSKSYALQNAWLKYGEDNFEWIILETLSEGDDCIIKEEDWIIKMDSIKNGYNIKLPYTQQKLQNTQYQLSYKANDWYLKYGPPSLKNMTKEEWIEKKKADPKFHLPKNNYIKKGWGDRAPKKSVVGVDITGTVLHTYPSISDTYKSFGKEKNNALDKCLKVNCLYDKLHKSRECYWFFEVDYDKDRFLEVLNKPKIRKKYIRIKKEPKPYSERNIKRAPIKLQDSSGQELDFPSMSEASKFLKCSIAQVYCLKRGYKNNGKGKIKKVNHIKGWKFVK